MCCEERPFPKRPICIPSEEESFLKTQLGGIRCKNSFRKGEESGVTCGDSKMAFPVRLICIESGVITGKRHRSKKKVPRFHMNPFFCRTAD